MQPFYTDSSKANKVGYLVRIAPNEVACSDPNAIKVVDTTRATFAITNLLRSYTAPRLSSVKYYRTQLVSQLDLTLADRLL